VTWFSWRQARAQTATAVVMLAIVAVIAAVTGPDVVHLYQTEVGGCASRGDCQAAAAAVAGYDGSLRTWLGVLVVVAPAIIGMFWGAPLVARELEDGTVRLAWTQSVTRIRWLAVRLSVTGLASMAAAGLLSLLVTWWASPLDRAGTNQFGSFDERGIVPVGYAAFAFALGVTFGVLMRRTLPAMISTLVMFIAVRLAVIDWVRPRLIAPVVERLPVTVAGYGTEGFLPVALLSRPSLQLQPPDLPNAWITSIDVVSRTGGGLSGAQLAAACPGIGNGPGPSLDGPGHVEAPQGAAQGLQRCGARLSTLYREAVSYQPAGRYWPLQWCELAIFLVVALALAGACIWRVRRIG
jgi:hypothetical protein